MLTRLKISGFKNLIDVDISFGPFTCVAGANGVGKSNLFDAISFLSALASDSLVDAALSVRDDEGKTADIKSLFHRVGDANESEMSFEAEMIVPAEGWDDLGQKAKASITFLRYSLMLAYRPDTTNRYQGGLEIIREELRHINIGESRGSLQFPHKAPWRRSVIRGRRTSPFISTTEREGKTMILLHQDGRSGRQLQRLASTLPRTVLSATNAAESPTALLARREMQSWKMLQLEPTALRRPDTFNARPRLGADGSHLPATLSRLTGHSPDTVKEGDIPGINTNVDVYSQIAVRLTDLIDDVRRVWVEKDEKRELLTLYISGRDGTPHPARSLSDGTLRFLALAVLELDPEFQGLLCLEEPENGIHPERIPAVLAILENIAVSTSDRVDNDNPLRQVIINTHSPVVVAHVPAASLIVAEPVEAVMNNKKYIRVVYSSLPKTWRDKTDSRVVSRGKLLSYLSPFEFHTDSDDSSPGDRVVDRDDLQLLLLPKGDASAA